MRALSFMRLFATCRQLGGVPPRRAAPSPRRPVLAEGRRKLSIGCDTSRIYGCARVSAFFRRGLLMASLLCAPFITFAESDYSASLTAIENLLSNINESLRGDGHEYTTDIWGLLTDLDHYWSAFDGNFSDLMDDVASIESNSHDIENKLVQVSGKLADIYTRLGYVNNTCSSILANLDMAYLQFEAINGAVTRIARDVAVYGDAILTAFSTLQTTVNSIDVHASNIDDTMQDLLQAVLDLSVVTNGANGVVYDFSVLTNGFGRNTTVSGYPRGLAWNSWSDLTLDLTTSALSTIPTTAAIAKANLSAYLQQLYYNTYVLQYVQRYMLKSSVISALASVSISNNVGIAVEKLTSIDEHLDSIDLNIIELIDGQSKISTHVESIDYATEWLTNDVADILALLIAYTNVVLSGFETEKTKLEDENTKAIDDVNDEFKGVKQTNGTFHVSFMDPSAYERVGMAALENQFPTTPPSVYDFNIQIPRYSYNDEEILRESTLEATPADIEKIIHFFSIVRQLFTLLAWLFGWYVLHLHFRFFMWVVDKYFQSVKSLPKE